MSLWMSSRKLLSDSSSMFFTNSDSNPWLPDDADVDDGNDDDDDDAVGGGAED